MIFTVIALLAAGVFVVGQRTLHNPVPNGGEEENDLDEDL